MILFRILNEVKQEVLQSPCLEEDVISSDSDSDAQPNSSNRLLLNTVSNNRIKAMMIHHHDCRTAQLVSSWKFLPLNCRRWTLFQPFKSHVMGCIRDILPAMSPVFSRANGLGREGFFGFL